MTTRAARFSVKPQALAAAQSTMLGSLWTYSRLTRLENGLLAAVVVIAGSATTARVHGSSSVFLACISVTGTVAAANCFNDVLDIEADKLFKAHRPIPSGAISDRTALVATLLLSVTSLVAAAFVSWSVSIYTIASLVLSGLYSARLKGIPFIGNLTVAGLAGSAGLLGALAAGGSLQPNTIAVCTFVFTGMLCVETVKTMEDSIGDAFAGYRTFVHKLSEVQQMLYLRLLLLCFALSSTALVWVLAGGRGFLVEPGLLLAAGPLSFVASDRRSPKELKLCLTLSKVTWPVAALLLLSLTAYS